MKSYAPLIGYIETEIIPRYTAFDGAHGIDHVRTVIRRSLELAARCRADREMARTIAAFHDTGLAEGRERHHLVSGEILAADPVLPEFFSPQQRTVMREAVEDHRASSDHAPRSIYGRIVAEADRCIDPQTVVWRTIRYGQDRHPDLGREEQFLRCREHLIRKYGEEGYLRLWIPESDNARQLEELRRVLRSPDRLHALFDALYERRTAPEPQSI